MAFINRNQMEGLKYVQKFREYLDYIEDHLVNVQKAFNELSKKCEGMWWVGDDMSWHSIRQQVCHHDTSKFSIAEFNRYRAYFFPIDSEEKNKAGFEYAWRHHKRENSPHHETVKDNWDIVHMVIDWTAMGYKFGDTAQEYYENNMDRIELTEDQKKVMYEIFDKIAAWKE